jgi:hypothetical protein
MNDVRSAEAQLNRPQLKLLNIPAATHAPRPSIKEATSGGSRWYKILLEQCRPAVITSWYGCSAGLPELFQALVEKRPLIPVYKAHLSRL